MQQEGSGRRKVVSEGREAWDHAARSKISDTRIYIHTMNLFHLLVKRKLEEPNKPVSISISPRRKEGSLLPWV